jgi:N-acetylmuramoyl-L-alanine amidase
MSILIVQMGHSGRTSGATGAPGEMAFTEAVGAACARLLNASGWTCRTIPADPPPAAYRGDAFVAVHADGSNNPDVRGASVGYQNDPGNALAHRWRDAYIRRGFSGPCHPDNYTENLHYYYGVGTAIGQGNRNACIIECGTITNAADKAMMAPERVALAIGDALGIFVTQEEIAMYLSEVSQGQTKDNGYVLADRVDALLGNAEKTGGIGETNKLAAKLADIEDKLDQVLSALSSKG